MATMRDGEKPEGVLSSLTPTPDSPPILAACTGALTTMGLCVAAPEGMVNASRSPFAGGVADAFFFSPSALACKLTGSVAAYPTGKA